jgi:threonine 3-dehydrogenase
MANMRALTFDRTRETWNDSTGMVLEEVPRPVLDALKDPKDNKRVIVKVRYAGFCGTDRGIWSRKAFGSMILDSMDARQEQRRIFGHELLGEIVELGATVKASGKFTVGETISAESHLVCWQCYQCLEGQHHVCANEQILGVSADGCFADYVKLPADCLWKTNLDRIRPEVAAIQEPFGNAVHACQVADLRGRTVVILGTGTIGLLAVLVAQGLGAGRVIGVDPNPQRRVLAEQLGCDLTLCPNRPPAEVPWQHDPELVNTILEATNGRGADVCLEMSGFPDSINSAIQMARRGGQVVLFGVKDGDMVIENSQQVVMNGLRLQGVVGRRLWKTWNMGRSLLEESSNGIQDAIWTTVLGEGKGSIVDMNHWDREGFEDTLGQWPKPLLRFS